MISQYIWARNLISSDILGTKGKVKHESHQMNDWVSVEFYILADFEKNVTFVLNIKILFILRIQYVYMTDF